jgi:septum formation protein
VPPFLALASASPRRRELLAKLGLPFASLAVEVDERLKRGAAPVAEARRLALAKAQAAAARLKAGMGPSCCGGGGGAGWVLGADTLVWLGRKPLEKPKDPQDAFRMLKALSGRRHQVLTGLALVPLGGPARPLSAVEATQVHFRNLSDSEIHAYVRSGGPLDKAGAYGIQEQAGVFVDRIEGCYFNVMGLPLSRTRELLERAGFEV